jgi:hypothetical protein
LAFHHLIRQPYQPLQVVCIIFRLILRILLPFKIMIYLKIKVKIVME